MSTVNDDLKIMICPDCCKKHGRFWKIWIQESATETLEHNCEDCGKSMIVTNLTRKDFRILNKISMDYDFLKAMMDLKDRDIIEYNLKLSQFKTQVEKQSNVQVTSNQIKCPKCGSTAVTTGERGYSLLTGFLGAGKTVNRCGSCGYKWKP